MAGWNFGSGSGPQTYGANSMDYRRAPWDRQQTFTNANPWSQDWMNQTGNEQNMLNSMLFGGGAGGGAGLLSQYMNPMSSGGFMSQFLSTAPALQGLTRTASEAETKRASDLGRQGQLDASAGFAGLGSKYSGANLFAGNKAYQDSMGDLSGKIASENFGLLNNLYGNTLTQYAGAQGQGLQNLFGLYGLNAGNLAGASNPMLMADKTWLDKMSQIVGMVGSAASAVGSLI